MKNRGTLFAVGLFLTFPLLMRILAEIGFIYNWTGKTLVDILLVLMFIVGIAILIMVGFYKERYSK